MMRRSAAADRAAAGVGVGAFVLGTIVATVSPFALWSGHAGLGFEGYLSVAGILFVAIVVPGAASAVLIGWPIVAREPATRVLFWAIIGVVTAVELAAVAGFIVACVRVGASGGVAVGLSIPLALYCAGVLFLGLKLGRAETIAPSNPVPLTIDDGWMPPRPRLVLGLMLAAVVFAASVVVFAGILGATGAGSDATRTFDVLLGAGFGFSFAGIVARLFASLPRSGRSELFRGNYPARHAAGEAVLGRCPQHEMTMIEAVVASRYAAVLRASLPLDFAAHLFTAASIATFAYNLVAPTKAAPDRVPLVALILVTLVVVSLIVVWHVRRLRAVRAYAMAHPATAAIVPPSPTKEPEPVVEVS